MNTVIMFLIVVTCIFILWCFCGIINMLTGDHPSRQERIMRNRMALIILGLFLLVMSNI